MDDNDIPEQILNNAKKVVEIIQKDPKSIRTFNIVTEYLLKNAEINQERSIEAEKFITDLLKMPWYKRIFIPSSVYEKIYWFLHDRNKYDILLVNNKPWED